MKVLHIAQILQGGTASHISELIALQNRAHGPASIAVLAPLDQAGYLEGLAPGQLHTFATSARDPRSLLRFAAACRAIIGATRPDVIHLHGTFAGFVVRAMGFGDRRRRPAIVYCSHGWSFNMRMSAAARTAFAFAERMLAARTDKILCISRYETETALQRGLPPARLTTVYNGIADCDPAWLGASDTPDRLRLLFVGRDCRQKGFDVLVKAMAAVTDAPITLVAVGPEPREGLAPNIQALGWLDRGEVPTLLNRVDALVMPSRWEGFGLAALEAMRQGRAVIATSVDALPELVVDGETGILVPPEDPEELARVLRGLDVQTLQRMGRLGRERYLAHFTAETLYCEIERVYAEVMRPHEKVI